jgi:isoleucyl-tRNA synthetase
MDLPKKEKEVLKFWEDNKIFQKTLEKNRKKPRFVFYEGPPFANGKPGIHHLLARSFKDAILRYKTMKGFFVERKAGWDTHGLPTEMETEKQLKVKSKKEIEAVGIEKFAQECEKNIFNYKSEWEEFTKRIGFWLDLDNPYITCDPGYMESVWWELKQIWGKGFLYEDYKVIPYCPRCGTSLSSHEVAQGYKKTKDPAIYVKFKIKKGGAKLKGSYLVAWTTTPWTLPANVAIAINPEFIYYKVKVNGENLIVAKGRLEKSGIEGEIIERLKGEELIGIDYEPLFDIKSAKGEKNIYKVIGADFVSLEEGTGLVHIAPAFGEDDMKIGKENDLPVLVTVDEEGKFKEEVTQWKGKFVKSADASIIEELKKRELILKEEEYTHDYPFCWRCDTPLLYYAKKSWFVNMQKVKEELLSNNEKINWVPGHLKEGRFGEWLRGIKDWNLTRERYWGTPLPVWKCSKCNHIEVIGSRNDLSSQDFSNNDYYLMRHGHSCTQEEKRLSSWPEKRHCPLTTKGRKEISELVKNLKKEKIDLIFSSDLLRTKETAEIASREIGVKVNFDKRLREIIFGEFEGKSTKDWRAEFLGTKRGFTNPPEGGESFGEVKLRVFDFIKELEKKYKGKKILIVSHGAPLWFLQAAVKGLNNEEILERFKDLVPSNNEIRKIRFKEFPYDKKGDLNFHRPYVDEVKFKCPKCGSLMERVPEVIDCWFDSGSVPYAQLHYPFENKDMIDEREFFPADFICEGVDQTRGWFYTLLAISTLLGFGISYKNVISLGIVLDAKGRKMSKSRGIIVDPQEVARDYGVDCARFYFYTINSPGEPKRFDFKELKDLSRKFFGTFWNSFRFLSMYSNKEKEVDLEIKPENLLDKWIISKLENLKEKVDKKMKEYQVVDAARLFDNFVDDLSNWYIRRSRKRFQKPESEKEKEDATQILSYTLIELSKLIAPFTPFFAESIYREMPSYNGKKESVHLCDYPEPNRKLINKDLEEKMEKIREVVALTLNKRADAGIKVRQPLSSLKINKKRFELKEKDLINLIKEEVNVKEVSFEEIKGEIELDTTITPSLREEGIIREILRHVKSMRKKAGYKPRHEIIIYSSGDKELNDVLQRNKDVVLKETKAKNIEFGRKEKMAFGSERETSFGQKNLWLAIKKV